jgi:hypothetical protein
MNDTRDWGIDGLTEREKDDFLAVLGDRQPQLPFLTDTQPSTTFVLADVAAERGRQIAHYGNNSDLADGTGLDQPWLGLGFEQHTAWDIQIDFRADYESYEAAVGKPTWMHLVREEVAEAFQESDPARLRAELIQVAALCVSWIEKLDAR